MGTCPLLGIDGAPLPLPVLPEPERESKLNVYQRLKLLSANRSAKEEVRKTLLAQHLGGDAGDPYEQPPEEAAKRPPGPGGADSSQQYAQLSLRGLEELLAEA